MTKFERFSVIQLSTIKGDVAAAKQLAKRCMNALIYRPGGPTHTIQKLLFDTFMISVRDWNSGNNWDKSGDVQMNFGAFGGRMDIITCRYSEKSPTEKGKLEFGAYVSKFEPNIIFLTPHYFNNANQKRRAATLIHEFIHMVQKKGPHPGKVPIMFQQAHLGIPFDQAIDNPYCYQYFAEWLQ